MKAYGMSGLIVAAVAMAGGAVSVGPAAAADKAEPTRRTWSFDDVAPGELPTGWRVEATGQQGPLATWRVIDDRTAPSGKRVFALTSPNHPFSGVFNLCWTRAVAFLDGEITVRLKALTGREDQGGGVIWRVRDKDNYYIARFNPLEDNFRVYRVRGGVRRTLASARVVLPAKQWHTLRIVQRGARIEGYLNGKRLLGAEDSTFAAPGGVGLWTKADAATAFDDFSVTTTGAPAPTASPGRAQPQRLAEAASKAKSTLVRTLLSGAKVSLTQAIVRAEQAVKGARAYEAELDIDDGRVVYEVNLFVAGSRREVVVDAATGRIIDDDEADD